MKLPFICMIFIGITTLCYGMEENPVEMVLVHKDLSMTINDCTFFNSPTHLINENPLLAANVMKFFICNLDSYSTQIKQKDIIIQQLENSINKKIQ